MGKRSRFFPFSLPQRMSKDISKILGEWPFEPDDVMVRIISGDDGRKKLQLRIDLGMLQMEMEGRPDGVRPENCESWLDHYEHRQRTHDEHHPDGPPFLLKPEDCGHLWREGVQYYHRYLSYWHLEMYDYCSRDTQRNLRLFAFIRAFAGDDRMKMQFDQWRPYVLMMHTRAMAMPLVLQKAFREAFRVIDAGIEGIRDFLDEYNQSHRTEECVELTSLEHWREELLAHEEAAAALEPKSKIQALRQKLDRAIADEEFEEAARLRDQIRTLSEKEADE
jgi:hypothetical protein